jgi:hypothetical protein
VLYEDAAVLQPHLSGDVLAVSVQKIRHRQKKDAAVALSKEDLLPIMMGSLTFISLARSETSSLSALTSKAAVALSTSLPQPNQGEQC